MRKAANLNSILKLTADFNTSEFENTCKYLPFI